MWIYTQKDKLLSKIEELENEVTRRGEDLTKAKKSFKQEVVSFSLRNNVP